MATVGNKKTTNTKDKSTKIVRDIRLTFKEDEQDIREYLESKSSATCFLKDLARLEMQREKKMLEKITEIIAEQLDVDAASINAETSFKDDLEADSLDLFELIMAVEEEYGVEIPSEDLENIKTVQDIMDYLTAKGVEA